MLHSIAFINYTKFEMAGSENLVVRNLLISKLMIFTTHRLNTGVSVLTGWILKINQTTLTTKRYFPMFIACVKANRLLKGLKLLSFCEGWGD